MPGSRRKLGEPVFAHGMMRVNPCDPKREDKYNIMIAPMKEEGKGRLVTKNF